MKLVVTGANRGLDRETARACMAEGAHALLSARDGALLKETSTEPSGMAFGRQWRV